ncbi:hypothetical protein J4209_06980 [Candidatus Woesearchaeota archaeon]|nr:hypothetical protein [Candidatus Woesearchaeota archaeon]
MTSAFIRYEGNTPKNRIMEFLVTFAIEDDYSMMDITKHSKVSYATLKNVWGEFVKEKRVVFTRFVGKAKMYKLNVKSPIIKKFIEYYWKIIEEESEEKPKISYNSAPSAGAVSAQHI